MNWKLFFRITWIMTVIGIIILSLLPPANMNYQLYGNDKIGHTFAYAILSLSIYMIIPNTATTHVVILKITASLSKTILVKNIMNDVIPIE